MSSLIIRQATEQDGPTISRIYNSYILNSVITFETEAVNPTEMGRRIREKIAQFEWIVGVLAEKIIGYAYYGHYRERAAYRQTVESTIYLDPEKVGKGYGQELYRRLITTAQNHGYHEMIGVIALPNLPSSGLHSRLGFREVGVLKNVGFKFGRFIDTAIWQKEL
jgi:L-amino acid N-acyltransferase YncA